MISICKNNILPAIVFCFVVGGGFFYGSFQEAAATQALEFRPLLVLTDDWKG